MSTRYVRGIVVGLVVAAVCAATTYGLLLLQLPACWVGC